MRICKFVYFSYSFNFFYNSISNIKYGNFGLCRFQLVPTVTEFIVK